MSLTAVDLCSAALLKLGARPITSLDQPTIEAEAAARLYPIVRDALLVAHPWSFTLAVAALEADDGEPLAEFARSFTLPADHLRTIAAGAGPSGRGLTYRIQGGRLLASIERAYLTYQRRVDEGDFPAFFVQPLVTRLAAELCIPVTEGTSRAAELLEMAELELRRARLLDSQQNTPRAIEDFTLIGARFG